MKNKIVFLLLAIFLAGSYRVPGQEDKKKRLLFPESGIESHYWLHHSIITGTVQHIRRSNDERWIVLDINVHATLGNDYPISSETLTLKYIDSTFHGGFLNDFLPEKGESYVFICLRGEGPGENLYNFTKLYRGEAILKLSSSKQNKLLPSNISVMKLENKEKDLLRKISRKINRTRLIYYNKDIRNLLTTLWRYLTIPNKFENGNELKKQTDENTWPPDLSKEFWYDNALVSGTVTSVDQENDEFELAPEYVHLTDRMISTESIRLSYAPLRNEEGLVQPKEGEKYLLYLISQSDENGDSDRTQKTWALSENPYPIFPGNRPIMEISGMSEKQLHWHVLRVHAARLETYKKHIDQLLDDRNIKQEESSEEKSNK